MSRDQFDPETPNLLVHSHHHIFGQKESVKRESEIDKTVVERSLLGEILDLGHEPGRHVIHVRFDAAGVPLFQAEDWSIAKERPDAGSDRCRDGRQPMIWRICHMGVINDCRGAGVKGFETATQLAPEDVLGRVVIALHVACGVIIKEGVVCMTAFQLGLPDMVVSVDEARGDDSALAINYLGRRIYSVQVAADFLDVRARDENVGICKSLNMVMVIMLEHDTPFQEQR